jgi:hypothetical protein
MLPSQPKVIYSVKRGNRHMSNNFKHGVIAENMLITVIFVIQSELRTRFLMLRTYLGCRKLTSQFQNTSLCQDDIKFYDAFLIQNT